MSEQLQLRYGTAAQLATLAGAPHEIWFNTDDDRLVAQDGFTLGGFPLARLTEDKPFRVLLGSLGAVVGDGAGITVQNTAKTAAQIYQPASPSGYFYNAAIRGVVDLEAGTSIVNAAAFDAYVYSNVAAGTGAAANSGVGYGGAAILAEDGAAAWGYNFSIGDAPTNGLQTLSGRRGVGMELDYTCNGASIFEGVSLIMQGVGTPTAANAFQVSIASPTSVAKWINALVTDSGALTGAGFSLGALAVSGVNVASQPGYLSAFDSSGAGFALKLEAINHFWRLTDNTLATGLLVGHGASQISLGPTGPSNASLVLSALGSGTVFANSALVAGSTLAAIGEFFLEGGQSLIGKDTSIPTTGQTVSLSAAKALKIINPAGTLASLTVALPSSPTDGQRQKVLFGAAISALTVSASGASVVGSPTAIAMTFPTFEMIYDQGTNTWFRMQ